MKDITDALEENNNDIYQLVKNKITPYNFTFFSIKMFFSRSLTKTERVLIENYPKEWRIHYDENNYHNDDPILAYAKTSNTPIHWHKLLNDTHSEGEAVLNSAARFGIGPGFSIPFRGKTGTFGIISINSADENPCHEDYALCIKEILAITPYLYEQMAQPIELKTIKLTKREQECLFWACEGKTAWEISQIIGCSDRTVVFHLNNISEKFGTQNRYQTITHALLSGAITPQLF
ncbi:helix-turn-helix transcriptional regulator [Serratia proteamaculans]|uniref:helix-turn-helix transcriptional regulator n=1 Tax=Serratia proteamaculans TaxID=28151 RepID=UPI003D04DCA5